MSSLWRPRKIPSRFPLWDRALPTMRCLVRTQRTSLPVAGTPLGVSFIDVARQSGLNAKTIYGGEHKNRYLLETTGCGVAFYDYDHDDWLDIFLVNGPGWKASPKDKNPSRTSSRTIAMAPSLT